MPAGKLLVLLALLILTSGCVQEQQPVPTYKIYVEDLPPDVPAEYGSAIKDAMGYWEKTGFVNFVETKDPNDMNIQVQWVKEFGGPTLGQTASYWLVQVGLGDSKCMEKYQPYVYDTVLLIAEHELGHAIGYEHSNDTSSIMYPYSNLVIYESDWNELAILGHNVAKMLPLCTGSSHEYAEYAFEVTSDEPVAVVLVPNRTEAVKVADYQSYEEQNFVYYPNCSADGVKYFKKTCPVAKGFYLVIVNPNDSENAEVHYSAKQTPAYRALR